jgi:hypothetical protein
MFVVLRKYSVYWLLSLLLAFVGSESVAAGESFRPKRISFSESGELVRETKLRYDHAGNIVGGSDVFYSSSGVSEFFFKLSYNKDGLPLSVTYTADGDISTIMDYGYQDGKLESVTHYHRSRDHRLYQNVFVLENNIIRGYRLISYEQQVKSGEMIYHYNEKGFLTGKEYYENNVLTIKITNQYDAEHRLRRYTIERFGSGKISVAIIDYELGFCTESSYCAFFWE